MLRCIRSCPASALLLPDYIAMCFVPGDWCCVGQCSDAQYPPQFSFTAWVSSVWWTPASSSLWT